MHPATALAQAASAVADATGHRARQIAETRAERLARYVHDGTLPVGDVWRVLLDANPDVEAADPDRFRRGIGRGLARGLDAEAARAAASPMVGPLDVLVAIPTRTLRWLLDQRDPAVLAELRRTLDDRDGWARVVERLRAKCDPQTVEAFLDAVGTAPTELRTCVSEVAGAAPVVTRRAVGTLRCP